MTDFRNNNTDERFEYEVNGSIAFADYRLDGQTLYIEYVEAPPKLRGSGAAGKLMSNILEYSEKHNLEIVPICGYAASWLARKNK